jgi:hypothetical protein
MNMAVTLRRWDSMGFPGYFMIRRCAICLAHLPDCGGPIAGAKQSIVEVIDLPRDLDSTVIRSGVREHADAPHRLRLPARLYGGGPSNRRKDV